MPHEALCPVKGQRRCKNSWRMTLRKSSGWWVLEAEVPHGHVAEMKKIQRFSSLTIISNFKAAF